MTLAFALTRRLPVKGLLPLLLSAAVSQAYAVDHGANGAADNKNQTLSGAGNVSATLSATGGNGGDGALSGGNGGAASAVLDLTALWTANATISATGGNGGNVVPANPDSGYGYGGDATASGVLHGAGAAGSATAQGGSFGGLYAGVPNAGNATSSLTALTSGAQAVDLASSAYAGLGGGASVASLLVDSGVAQPAAGHASVTGNVKAIGNDATTAGNSTATLGLRGSGNLSGSSLALAGAVFDDPYVGQSPRATALSTVTGVTSGQHDVSLTSTAKTGVRFPADGTAIANASGQSGSGKVVVGADASTVGYTYVVGAATAHAVARATEQGGSATATASADGMSSSALAEAYSVGAGSAKAVAIGSTGELLGGGSTIAHSTSTDGGQRALYASVVSASNYTATSETSFGGLGLVLPGLQSPYANGYATATAGGAAGLGGGVQAANGPGFGYVELETHHSWQQSIAADHLWLKFLDVNSTPLGYFSLDISNNGQSLYFGEFNSQSEADQFFIGHALDLGPLGVGMQNLVIHSSLATGSYGFSYILAVPEPLEWLLMLSGLTLVMVAARRKSRQS
ncbi:hypothetical protein GJ697_28050 [Pseudoduganella sp. FT25W]|uniref:PEP-CTERM sorting domain-containing protein n=1 Tax=Duganella alba TaxID=2666081 RepID=A0A6L5QPS6_9BURK|nr:hypothetical protein [Duganella alba]MRX11687.1 hypothetical protein [Duganella alba]MRX20016.1 hypothetical protein [Duganella alba]